MREPAYPAATRDANNSPDALQNYRDPRDSFTPGSLDEIRALRLDGIKILLTDDSVDNRLLFERILKMAGAEVDLAENGESAIKMGMTKNYDVILMDICMPFTDGFTATKTLRLQGFSGPIVALTAQRYIAERDFEEAGFTSSYLKPIDRLSLLRAVVHACMHND